MKNIVSVLILIVMTKFGFSQCPIPTPPPTLTVIATSPYSVTFTTNPASSPTIGYRAEREPQGGVFAPINSGYPNGVFPDSFQLLPNQTFCYRTRAATSCGTLSDYTQEVMVTMPDGPPPFQGAPDAPSGLTTAMNGTKVFLQWTAGYFPGVQGQTQTFQIAKSTDGGVTWRPLNTLTASSTNDAAVVSGNVYWYKVRSFNGFGWSTGYSGACGVQLTTCGTAWSNVASISVP